MTTFGERAAVAVSWIDGSGLPEGVGDPAALGSVLSMLREVEITPALKAVLHSPRRYADGRPSGKRRLTARPLTGSNCATTALPE